MKSPNRCSAILANDLKLAQLTDHARFLAALDKRVNKFFEHPLAQHVKVASLRDEALVIQADSPAWAARARYATPQVLKQLAASSGEFPSIRTIRIRVAVGPYTPAPKSRHRQNISNQAADELRRQAQTIADDRLRDALLRLAQRRNSK